MAESALSRRNQTIISLIEQMKPQIARALPRHISPDRMARIATTVLRQTPQLAMCTPESFLGALMTASQLGLEPGPLGEAYLVPYGDVCTFIAGYRGLVKLAYQSEQVATVSAHVVHAEDKFDFRLGLDPFLDHRPVLTDEPGAPIAAYAVVRMTNGAAVFEVLSVKQIEDARKRSRAANSGPWVTDWEPMARKTALRRLAKWIPLSTEFQLALAHDEAVRTDVGDLADAGMSRPGDALTQTTGSGPITEAEILGTDQPDPAPTPAQPTVVEDGTPPDPGPAETGDDSPPARKPGRPKGSKNRPKPADSDNPEKPIPENVTDDASSELGDSESNIRSRNPTQNVANDGGESEAQFLGNTGGPDLGDDPDGDIAGYDGGYGPEPTAEREVEPRVEGVNTGGQRRGPNDPASDEQLTKLAILRKNERYTDDDEGRADWFAWLSAAVQRNVTSNKQLSVREASEVIELLEEAQTQDRKRGTNV